MSVDPHAGSMQPKRTAEAAAAVRGSIALAAMQTLGRMSGLVFAVVAGRALPPNEFGRYSVAIATVQLFGVVADLGTTAAITRLVSRREYSAQRVLAATIPFSLVLGIGSSVVTVALSSMFLGSTALTDLSVAALVLPFQAMNTSIFGALDGSGRVATRGVLGFLSLAIQYLGASAVLAMTSDVRLALWCAPLAALLTFATAAVASRILGLWRLSVSYDPRLVRSVFALGFPFALLAGISLLASRLDLVLINALSGTEETAYYDVAVRAMEAAAYLAAALAAPVLVLTNARLSGGDRDGAQRVLDLAVGLAFGLGLGVSAVTVGAGDAVVELLFGKAYGDAVIPLRILGGQVWLVFVVSVQGSVLMGGARIRSVVPLAAAVTSVTVLLDLILIPRSGALGAAFATAVSTVIAFFAFRTAIDRWNGLRTPYPDGRLVLAWLLAVAMSTVLGAAGPGEIAIAAATYGSISVLSGGIRVRELVAIVRSARTARAGR